MLMLRGSCGLIHELGFGFLASKEVKDAGVGNLGLQDRKFLRSFSMYFGSLDAGSIEREAVREVGRALADGPEAGRMTILGSSRSITFSSSKPYSSNEGGTGAPRPIGMTCDAPGCWRLGGRHARFLVDFCERYRLEALCACFLRLLAGGGAWLAF